MTVLSSTWDSPYMGKMVFILIRGRSLIGIFMIEIPDYMFDCITDKGFYGITPWRSPYQIVLFADWIIIAGSWSHNVHNFNRAINMHFQLCGMVYDGYIWFNIV